MHFKGSVTKTGDRNTKTQIAVRDKTKEHDLFYHGSVNRGENTYRRRKIPKPDKKTPVHISANTLAIYRFLS